MVLGKLTVSGRPTYFNSRARAYCACSVGADRSCLDIISLVYHFFLLSHSLWPDIDCNTASKGREAQNNQPTNQAPGAH